MKFADLFAGIGGIRLAFENAGCECVFSCEIDASARETYAANFRDIPAGDIRNVKSSDIPAFDILLAFFPCQAFSVIGKRERIIIVGFRENLLFTFPSPVPECERRKLSDILETNPDRKYYVSDSIRQSRLSRLKDKNFPKPYISHENVAGTVTPHEWSAALRARASANYILINDERRPTEREMLRLQGFPESFRIVVPYGKMKQQCGNSVAVPVIEAVAREMLKAMRESE